MSEDNKDNTDPETLKVENLAIEDKNAAAGDEQAATKTDKQKSEVLIFLHDFFVLVFIFVNKSFNFFKQNFTV